MKMVFETGTMQSNLETFLTYTTPVAPRQILPKIETRGLNRLWHPSERESVEYFTLADLWNSFDEWSAYGAGVPIHLTTGETVVQYYVPYLSAIQIFTSNLSVNSFRDETESGDVEMRDSFSESCSSEESENERSSWRWDGSSSDEGAFGQESQCHFNDRLGYLYFQFFERSIPYERIPLVDKINGLARRYPGLMSSRSVDLSPASWMSVAWYPIYHIPMGKTIKDLSTCFLTYHTLSSSFQDTEEFDDCGKQRKEMVSNGIGLFPFGLATHKMQCGGLWVSSGGSRDLERVRSLLRVADSWLKQLRVQHHDFDYFNGMRHGRS